MLGAAPGSQASEMGSDSRGLDVDELKRLHFLGNLRFNLEIEFFWKIIYRNIVSSI